MSSNRLQTGAQEGLDDHDSIPLTTISMARNVWSRTRPTKFSSYLSLPVQTNDTDYASRQLIVDPGGGKRPIPRFIQSQFHIRTYFALTTYKTQFQSFGCRIGLDLRDQCFSYGNLYTSLSWTTHLRKVTVLTEESKQKTINLVYPEVLQYFQESRIHCNFLFFFTLLLRRR